jgi:DedD protein
LTKPVDKPAAAVHAGEDASGQWVVQLGAYKEAANVKLLLSKLKGVNVPAYTEKYDSPQGTRTRVRAGPFATQEAAEKARARIKIIGVDGPVAPKVSHDRV